MPERNFNVDLRGGSGISEKGVHVYKAVVDGPAGPAMAGPLFLPQMVLVRPSFWPNMFFAGPFPHVSSRPSLMIYFSMIKD